MKEIFEKMAKNFAQRERRKRSTQQNQLALWIGRIAIAFNELEARLAKEIIAELGHERTSMQDMIHASMSYGQKLDMFCALLMERFQENEAHLAYIRTVHHALSAAEECRNNVLHSRWTAHPVFSVGFERRKVRTKGRKGLKVDEAAANIAGLRTAAVDIEILGSIACVAARHERVAARYEQEAFSCAAVRLCAVCQSAFSHRRAGATTKA